MLLHQPTPSSSITPLETLVVQQIAEMLREERALEQRYNQLAGTPEDMHVFSNELSRFDQRAKRLFRLMQAMEGCCPEENELIRSYSSGVAQVAQ